MTAQNGHGQAADGNKGTPEPRGTGPEIKAAKEILKITSVFFKETNPGWDPDPAAYGTEETVSNALLLLRIFIATDGADFEAALLMSDDGMDSWRSTGCLKPTSPSV